MELEFPKPVKPATGNIAKVQGRRTAPPDGLGSSQEIIEMDSVVNSANPDIVRKTGRQKASAKVRL
jgi:hypothetical protein